MTELNLCCSWAVWCSILRERCLGYFIFDNFEYVKIKGWKQNEITILTFLLNRLLCKETSFSYCVLFSDALHFLVKFRKSDTCPKMSSLSICIRQLLLSVVGLAKLQRTKTEGDFVIQQVVCLRNFQTICNCQDKPGGGMFAVLVIAFITHRSSYVRRRMGTFFFFKTFFLSGRGLFLLLYLLSNLFL